MLNQFFRNSIFLLSLISIQILNAQYCEPEYADGSGLYYITQFNINNEIVENEFSGYNDPEYHDRSNISTEVMDQTDMDFSITVAWDGYVAVWIDFDESNTFETGEKILESSILADNPLSTSINMNYSSIGEKRIRIRYVDEVEEGTQMDACNEYENGMTVDHTVDIIAFQERAPEADFTTSTGLTSTTINDYLIFKDVSKYVPTSRVWEFEGGTPASSGAASPIVKYNEPGCYAVTLTVTNEFGTDTKTETCYINVSKYCYPDTTDSHYFDYYYIKSFSLGSISENFSEPGQSPNYAYFDQTSTPLSINTEYSGSIGFFSGTLGGSTAAWIDYNNDGEFTENERIFAIETPSDEGTVNFSFEVPEEAIAGETRLRIRKAGYEDTSEITPCEDHTASITQDYLVEIRLLIPIADFEADQTRVTQEDSVHFTDLSNNQTTEWLWNFGGAIPDTSTEQNPQNIRYPEPGTYTVTLKAFNAAGNNTATKEEYITVSYLPSAMFYADKTEIAAGESVILTDSSDNNPTSWTWYIDGVSFYTSDDEATKNPDKIFFNNEGGYDISLVVDGDASTKLSRTKKDYINVSGILGIDDIESYNPLELIPNPNNGHFAILLNGWNEQNAMIQVFDISGRNVFNDIVQNEPNIRRSITLDNLEKGIYILKVSSKRQSFSRKFEIY